ncbi:hypothetical protein ACWDSJ_21615 [Nocardia sp. NPDC003482]
MTEPNRSGEPDAGSALDVVAKSSAWQGFLSGASVIATSLLLEIVSKLLESWVGESQVLSSLSYWLSRIAALVVLAAAGYVLWRRLATVRDRARAERRLRLMAELIPPGPRTELGDETEPFAPQVDSSLDGNMVAAILRDLPFRRYEAAALYEMVTAVLAARRRVPDLERPRQERATAAVLDELRAAGVLDFGRQDRRVLVRVPRIPTPDTVRASLEWEAALPALLRHHADRATRWAAALDSPSLASGARRWFEQEQTYLRELIIRTAEHRADFGPSDDTTAAPRAVLDAAVPELVRIAEALDLWSARDDHPDANTPVFQAISELTSPGRYPVEHELARIRSGRVPHRSEISWLHPYKAALVARADIHRALALVSGRATRRRSRAAAWLLERAWRRVPRKDVAGEVAALIDLGLVYVREGRLEAARERLDAARSLADSGRDPAGAAHAIESLGVLWWARGERRRALRSWQRALGRYHDLDHHRGVARCLQHLGSAMVVAPEYGGQLLPEAFDADEVRAQAAGWLAEAERLRGHPLDHPTPACLATHYRDRARAALPERPLPAEIDRWPVSAPADRHA